MAYYNNVIYIGRLTADPELKVTQNGISVLSFTLAQNKKSKSGEQAESIFPDFIAWRQTADFISKYFKKGMRIGITGHIDTRRWTDKDGKNRKSTEIIVDEANFIDPKSSVVQNQSEPSVSESTPEENNFEELKSDDELPF